MFRFFKVTGESLQPLYEEGDFVLVCKIPSLFGGFRPGNVVVLRHSHYGILIKIVAEVLEGGALTVTGLHPASTDSRSFGAVSRRDIVGKVIWHIRRPGRGRSAHVTKL